MPDASDLVGNGGRLQARGRVIKMHDDCDDQIPPPTDDDAPVVRHTNGHPTRPATAAEHFVFRPTADIFAPLPEAIWVVRGLQIGPGRPTGLMAAGFTAKTLSAQSKALSIAAGRPVWNYFESKQGVVRHLDYEQGFRATARRYQRLAIGHGIDTTDIGDRLQLCVLPRIPLSSPDAYDAYSKAADGADLVIVDSLCAATPGVDENSSEAREGLDKLTLISERTGAAFVVIHHAGKPKESDSDKRNIGRGSSAIYQACGCVFVLMAGKTGSDPKRVTQTKTPAEGEGAQIEDFMLMVEDVPLGSNPTAGVRVVHQVLESSDADARASAQYDADATRLLRAITDNPGAAQATVAMRAGIQKSRALDVLNALADEGRLTVLTGPRGKKTYRPEGAR